MSSPAGQPASFFPVGVYSHGGMEFAVEARLDEPPSAAEEKRCGGVSQAWLFRFQRADGRSFEQRVCGFASAGISQGWEPAWDFAWHVAKLQIDAGAATGRDFLDAPSERDGLDEEGEEWKNG